MSPFSMSTYSPNDLRSFIVIYRDIFYAFRSSEYCAGRCTHRGWNSLLQHAGSGTTQSQKTEYHVSKRESSELDYMDGERERRVRGVMGRGEREEMEGSQKRRRGKTDSLLIIQIIKLNTLSSELYVMKTVVL